MEIKHELRILPFPPRQHAREYLKLNPLGTVPYFCDEDAKMTESAAICQYLVDRYGPTPLAVQCAEAHYSAYLNLIHFGEATLTFPQAIVLRYSRLEPEGRRSTQVVEDYKKWFFARLRLIDSIVLSQEYLCAGRFTIADISVGFSLLLAEYAGLAPHWPPAVAAYWTRLQAREGYQRARRVEENARRAQGIPETVW